MHSPKNPGDFRPRRGQSSPNAAKGRGSGNPLSLRGEKLNRFLLLAASIGTGAILFGLFSYLGSLVAAPEHSAALIEEAGKTLTLIGFAAWGQRIARRGCLGSGTASGSPLRTLRTEASGLARGLGYGLTAIVSFATIENLAYLRAFPATGILGRLLWSEPIHLIAALAEAIAVFNLYSAIYHCRQASSIRSRISASLATAAKVFGLLLFAWLWHAAGNILALGQVDTRRFALVALANSIALVALGLIYAQRVVIGGFLYGTE